MAAVWNAPVVFIIENNLYGEYSPIRTTTPVDDLADRAAAYAIPGIVVDGQEVASVHATVLTAIERARRGEGPTLIEAKTYRLRGHSRTDPGTYRPKDELDHWRSRDPITLLADALVTSGELTKEKELELRKQIQAEVDESARRAAEAPPITIDEMKTYVYSN
jgi:pyruvate dehydrogenase E1 component alpha subunit